MHRFFRQTKALRFCTSTPINGPGAFFQVIEAGFDRTAPDQALADGLEVYREFLVKNTQGVTRTHLGESVHGPPACAQSEGSSIHQCRDH